MTFERALHLMRAGVRVTLGPKHWTPNAYLQIKSDGKFHLCWLGKRKYVPAELSSAEIMSEDWTTM